ncbi:hypothetical protein HMSSN036_54480 [Paenibacillus macerans]|nr:hypothetical protein HMSSN036_54480 [Paenibacillus macerans]
MPEQRVPLPLREMLKLRQHPADLLEIFFGIICFKITAVVGDDLIPPRRRNHVVMSKERAAQAGKIHRLINAPSQHRISAIGME